MSDKMPLWDFDKWWSLQKFSPELREGILKRQCPEGWEILQLIRKGYKTKYDILRHTNILPLDVGSWIYQLDAAGLIETKIEYLPKEIPCAKPT